MGDSIRLHPLILSEALTEEACAARQKQQAALVTRYVRAVLSPLKPTCDQSFKAEDEASASCI
jgi:hypothetical protein